MQDARRGLILAQSLLGTYDNDSILTELLDSSKVLVNLIDSDLETLYMNHREQEGYEHVTVRLTNLLYTAADLVSNKNLTYEEGSNSYLALQNAEIAYLEIEIEIDEFLNEVYAPFVKKIDGLGLSPFDNGNR